MPEELKKSEEQIIQEPSPEAKAFSEFEAVFEERKEPEKPKESVVKEPVKEPIEEPALEIPPEQLEAGYAAGLSSDAISQLAETNPAVLKALAEFHGRAKEVSLGEEEVEEAPVEEFKGLEHVSAPELDFEDEKVRKVFETIVGNQNKLIDQLNVVNKEIYDGKTVTLREQEAKNQEFVAFVDNYFDTKVKEHPEIGLNRSLSKEQLKTRQGIFAVAKVLPEGTWQERLDTASEMWNVKRIKTEAGRELAAKLDGQKKKFSPRPGGQKSTKDVRSAEEKGMGEFEEIAEKYGHKWGE